MCFLRIHDKKTQFVYRLDSVEQRRQIGILEPLLEKMIINRLQYKLCYKCWRYFFTYGSSKWKYYIYSGSRWLLAVSLLLLYLRKSLYLEFPLSINKNNYAIFVIPSNLSHLLYEMFPELLIKLKSNHFWGETLNILIEFLKGILYQFDSRNTKKNYILEVEWNSKEQQYSTGLSVNVW